VTDPSSPATKPEWDWLWEMLAAELRRRGFENIERPEPEEQGGEEDGAGFPAGPPRRKYREAEPA